MERARHILFLGTGRNTLHLMAEVLAKRALEATPEGGDANRAGEGHERDSVNVPAGPTERSGGVALHEGADAGVISACMTPFGVDPLAAEAMAELGLEISDLPLRTPEDVDVFLVDLVVTLGDFDQSCRPRMPGMPPHLHWDIPEPPPGRPEDAAAHEARRAGFRLARDAIAEQIDGLLERGFLRALFSTRRNFELILDNLLDGVLAHTVTRRIFYFNQAAEEITGIKREEVLGRDCHSVFPGRFCGGECFFCEGALAGPDGRTAVAKADRGLVAETLFRRPDGSERLLQMHPTPLEDEEGVEVGALISFKDITELGDLRRAAHQRHSLSGIVGRDPRMLALFDLIREVGPVPVSVLIEGESGTGKEMVASAIHQVSPRADRPFVAVNCGALPEGLLESELFGHVKGAFTGAVRDKKGRFELAHGGTIFLDEVSEISPQMQVTLLRALQEREIQPVGGEHTIAVDVRVISATNRNLRALMDEGRFRPDLFYRLCVVPMPLPPLRERRLDIPLLVGHFLELVARETGREPLGISPDALDRLTRYAWPGNVRELRNAIEYAYVKCHGETIEPGHLPPEIRSPVAPATPPGRDTEGAWRAGSARSADPGRMTTPRPAKPGGAGRPRRAQMTRGLSREVLLVALERAGGNRKQAAALLGVGRATLYRYLERFGL